MPDPVAPTVVILLASALGLLVLVLALVLGISRRLARLEHRLAAAAASAEVAAAPSSAETSAGGAFEAFLDEEPARRALPKGEQFAQYRRWRQAHGMNWSKS